MSQSSVGLSLRGMSKSFPGQRALAGVDLDILPGTVHALLGANGSGKSTLIKILAGYHSPDPGSTAYLNGEPLTLGSATAAHRAGLRFVHQDLGLIPDLNVIDNLALGSEYAGKWWLSGRREAAAARELVQMLMDGVDVRRPVRELSPAQKTILAIARTLRGTSSAAGLLVLDEPTATLPAHEVDVLFEVVRRVQATGTPVLYVTHRLDEVFQIADTVSVLRDGRHVFSSAVNQTTQRELVTHIAGRPLDELYPAPPTSAGAVLLTARGVSGRGVRDLDLDLHAGEILGVAGLDGSGRDELNRLLFGQQLPFAGQITIAGTPVTLGQPPASISAGVGYLPADRRLHSATPYMTLTENVTLPDLPSPSLRWISLRAEQRDVRTWLKRLEVSPAAPERQFSTLSGGNQQKTVLARWLRRGSRVLLLDEPTQGVDVGGKQAIYNALGQAARGGAALLITSSDAEELAEICATVLVMRDGRITARLSGPTLTTDAIVSASLTEGTPA
ncbi:monosaccharide ABC transporter ATP-binding protein (CUT2 family) [Antricoccus suffuscus]|uniref:Monosaccharide ABC transporter ATP-binding protein (CUT2 family) n=1 Tax=Antricoccus suffuscus TaxID=1629062 RepID=A0A2T0ZTM7_9ACTN|nr:sugar ABC transporter ATP-binding protein [Antricoccus suffuscus]PRZ39710.1 monosaccharide ABC transporter ATP-binding protein (CUT2 family) [Antricoccus suffuscus]